MYEKRRTPPIHRSAFATRILRHIALAGCLLAVSLGMGMSGYMYFEGLSAVDAFLNSSMLLGGMGPVNPPLTNGGKLFAGFYALYAGLLFVLSAAIVFTPVIHRVLHKFHWEVEQ